MTEERKFDHLRISLEEDTQTKEVTSGFEDLHFVHRSLPELDKEKIDLSTTVFNHRFSAPIIVGAMTGGESKLSKKINRALASAVEEMGLGMGVGSQRAALENPKLAETYSVARDKAPSAFLMANIGGNHLIKKRGLMDAERAVDMIDADALAIHLNPLQEAIQLEGETNFSGILERINQLSETLEVPIIVKETGSGITAEDAKKLEEAGVAGIDISGAGGTSWAAVEYHRAKKAGDRLRERLGEVFWSWGTPSAICLIEAAESVRIPLIASGGIRSGIEAAKALTVGANLVGIAFPLLRAAVEGKVKEFLTFYVEELKNTMFLVGAKNVKCLTDIPIVITGKTNEWLRERGIDTENYARRS